MAPDDEYILNEFKKALRRNASETVVDLDHGFGEKFEFTFQRFEDILRDTNRSVPPNRWSYHRIGFTTEGGGEFTTGIYNFKAKKNTLIVVPSRVITSSKNWAPNTRGYFTLFNLNFFLQNNFPYKNIENKKIFSASYQPYVHLSGEQAKNIRDIFETILKEKNASNTSKNELIAVKLFELIVLSERYFSEQLNFDHDRPTLDIIKEFSKLVEKNFMEQRSVKFYAKAMNVHPNYLNSLVKKHTGITAKESIQNRLLLETKYLLHSTDLSVKEISNRVGFSDPNYFTSVFTQREKVSPSAYRASFI